MVGLTLLAEALAVGLTFNVAGDKLVIRGPRRAAAIAKRLLAHKADVMLALKQRSVETDPSPANPPQNVSNSDSSDQLIDAATLTPCPRCNSLEKWWPAVGEPRCQRCEPPTSAWRL
jgi:hypothetical protein